jgi:hypothetical protein
VGETQNQVSLTNEPRIDFILGSWTGTGFITDANGLEQYVENRQYKFSYYKRCSWLFWQLKSVLFAKRSCKYHVELHATVKAHLTVKEGHDIAHKLKDTLREEIQQLGQCFNIEPDTPLSI